MRFLIVIEETEAGFGIQVPDLAIATYSPTLATAKTAAAEAIAINLEAYQEAGLAIPDRGLAAKHFDNPDFEDLLFAYVDVNFPQDQLAA